MAILSKKQITMGLLLVLSICCASNIIYFFYYLYELYEYRKSYDLLRYIAITNWPFMLSRLAMIYLCITIYKKLHSIVYIDYKWVFALQLVAGMFLGRAISAIWDYIQYSASFVEINPLVCLTFNIVSALASMVLVSRITPLASPPMRIHWLKVTGGAMLLVLAMRIIPDALGISSFPPEFIIFGVVLCVGFALLAYFSPAAAKGLLSFTIQAVFVLTQVAMAFCAVIIAIIGGIMNRR